MFAELAFFSLVELTDPTQHRAYNMWHQLDHRPENLALPGVAWGDRWARKTRDGSAAAEYANVDYMAMYWFRSPLPESLDAWDRLGEDSFQWGRGPIIPGVERRMLAFFRPVKGYAAASARVSPDVIPFRPNRGLHVTLARFAEPHGVAAHDHFGWEDRTLIPALLEEEGVAGAWTFSFDHAQQHKTLPLQGGNAEPQGGLRIRLVYLDGEPADVTKRIEEIEASNPSPAADAAQVLLSTTATTIIPWQDW